MISIETGMRSGCGVMRWMDMKTEGWRCRYSGLGWMVS